MLRSHSSRNLNINDRKDRGSGLLSSLRGKKSSDDKRDKDRTMRSLNNANVDSLNGKSKISGERRRPRPLSTSVSALDLNQSVSRGSDDYAKVMAMSRVGAEGKENMPVMGPASKIAQRRRSFMSVSDRREQPVNKDLKHTSVKEEDSDTASISSNTRTLRPRSSANSLNWAKRSSLHLGNGMNSFNNMIPRLRSTKSFTTSADSAPSIKETNEARSSILSDNHSIEASYVADTIDSLESSGSEDTLYEDHRIDLSMGTIDSSVKAQRRTSNITNINELFQEINPSNLKVPMVSRKSMDAETLENNYMIKNLNQDSNYTSRLQLVENALFLTIEDVDDDFCFGTPEKHFNCDLNVSEYLKTIKEEPYHPGDVQVSK